MGERPTTWKPGQSGNPKGRPPKSRALTEILRKTGARKVTIQLPDGTFKAIAGREALARMVWEVATTGQVTLPDGTIKAVTDFADWFGCVQFIYKHIDGPPRTDIDVTSDGHSLMYLLSFGDKPDGNQDGD